MVVMVRLGESKIREGTRGASSYEVQTPDDQGRDPEATWPCAHWPDHQGS